MSPLITPTVDHVPLIRGYLEALAAEEGVPQARATEDFLRQTLFGPAPVAVPVLLHAGDERGSVPCGLAVYSWKWGAFSGTLDLYLHALYVERASRGRGVGQAALNALLALARSRGASRLELLTTAGHEATAAFYDRQGVAVATHMVVRRKRCAEL